jgi:hypothetical protein
MVFWLGFEVLTAVNTKMAVFWVVAPCSLVLMMEAARTSETLVNFYQTTRSYNPEDSHLLMVFWVVKPCRISEVYAAPIFKIGLGVGYMGE